MEIEQFYDDLRQDVAARADATGNFSDDSFAEVVTEYLVDAGSIEEFVPCKFMHTGIRIDGYALNWEDSLLELFAVDFRRGNLPERMSKQDMERGFKRAETFFERSCIRKFVDEMEVAHPAYGLARTILDHADKILRVRFYLLTNASLTGSVKEITPKTESHREWSYRIWDLHRLAKTVGSGEPEEIVVDFEEEFGSSLVCLPADDGKGDIHCYLSVIPGTWLAEIYDRYGGRLLEQNVRTFLQARGKVNRGIRRTILEEPRRFFPYNNGISATAEEIDVLREGGIVRIRSLRNLQIVNGGQTTASIYNAVKKDRNAPVELVSVQMKLSIVKPALASELVPKISRFANSQNKISDSDFFSNHRFHVVIENISRRLAAPAVDGSLIQKHWFYERAKGQYANQTAYLTPARKKEFEARNPRDKVISKTDLAKYVQTFRELPHEVSLGAQKNFVKFADYIGTIWEQKESDFNEHWFKRLIAEAIIFKRAESMVLAASWYAQGYRANTVAYGIALMMNRLRALGYELDVPRIWREQSLPVEFEEELLNYCHLAQERIISGAAANGVINVTEWAKRKACWEDVLTIRHSPRDSCLSVLRPQADETQDKTDARREQKAMSGAEAAIAVFNAGADYWRGLIRWAQVSDELKPSDLVMLDVASKMPRQLPNEKQSIRLLEIKEMFESGS